MWTEWRKANFAYFRKQLGDLPGSAKLVDLGCGALQFEELFKQFDYTGVDFQAYPHASVVCDLNSRFPFEDESFDILTASNTLEHIPDGAAFVHECFRITKKGGRIVGTVPFLMVEHQLPYDFNRYTHVQLEKMLKDAGFEDIEVVPLGKQMDVYNTIELKVFDELRKTRPGWLLEFVRSLRRLEMRLMRRLFDDAAVHKVTEGYGFSATRKS